jgi:hypothetical protein
LFAAWPDRSAVLRSIFARANFFFCRLRCKIDN